MLAEDDNRWSTLKSGYRLPLDPRTLVKRLENESDTKAVWDELWNELHHQGDVGDASYAAVPLLVEAHRKCGKADWNPYAIVTTIELARTEPHNLPMPAWLSDDCFSAIQKLSDMGLHEIADAKDIDSVRAILSVTALAKGLRAHAKLLVEYSEEELQQLRSNVLP
jgi:hypothetical protein